MNYYSHYNRSRTSWSTAGDFVRFIIHTEYAQLSKDGLHHYTDTRIVLFDSHLRNYGHLAISVYDSAYSHRTLEQFNCVAI